MVFQLVFFFFNLSLFHMALGKNLINMGLISPNLLLLFWKLI